MTFRVIQQTLISQEELERRCKKGAFLVLLDAAERTKDTTQEGILKGAILGAGHIASLPGKYPNADTGELHQSYRTFFEPNSFPIRTGSTVPYSEWLELGNSKMKPRPHLSPSFKKELPETRRNLRRAFRKAMS